MSAVSAAAAAAPVPAGYIFNTQAERKMNAADLQASTNRYNRRQIFLVEKLKREALDQGNKVYAEKGFTQFGRQTPRQVVVVNYWGNKFTTLIFDQGHDRNAGRKNELNISIRPVRLKLINVHSERYVNGKFEVEEAELNDDSLYVRKPCHFREVKKSEYTVLTRADHFIPKLRVDFRIKTDLSDDFSRRDDDAGSTSETLIVPYLKRREDEITDILTFQTDHGDPNVTLTNLPQDRYRYESEEMEIPPVFTVPDPTKVDDPIFKQKLAFVTDAELAIFHKYSRIYRSGSSTIITMRFKCATRDEENILRKIQNDLQLFFFCDRDCSPLTSAQMKELSEIDEMLIYSNDGKQYGLISGCRFSDDDLDKRELVAGTEKHKIAIKNGQAIFIIDGVPKRTLQQQSSDEFTNFLSGLEHSQIQPDKIGIVVPIRSTDNSVDQTAHADLLLGLTGRMDVSQAPNAFLQIDDALPSQ